MVLKIATSCKKLLKIISSSSFLLHGDNLILQGKDEEVILILYSLDTDYYYLMISMLHNLYYQYY
jgi:hypothetical protein